MAAMAEKIWTDKTIDQHPDVKAAVTAYDAAERAAGAAQREHTEADKVLKQYRQWSDPNCRQNGEPTPTTAQMLEAHANIDDARRRLLKAEAEVARTRKAAGDANAAKKAAIYAALEPQLARQARARAAYRAAGYTTHDLAIMATETLIHERAGRPVEGWAGFVDDYAAKVRERFGVGE